MKTPEDIAAQKVASPQEPAPVEKAETPEQVASKKEKFSKVVEELWTSEITYVNGLKTLETTVKALMELPRKNITPEDITLLQEYLTTLATEKKRYGSRLENFEHLKIRAAYGLSLTKELSSEEIEQVIPKVLKKAERPDAPPLSEEKKALEKTRLKRLLATKNPLAASGNDLLAFKETAPLITAYTPMRDLVTRLQAKSQEKGSSDLKNVLTSLDQKNGQPIPAFLITPVQRGPRYKLLSIEMEKNFSKIENFAIVTKDEIESFSKAAATCGTVSNDAQAVYEEKPLFLSKIAAGEIPKITKDVLVLRTADRIEVENIHKNSNGLALLAQAFSHGIPLVLSEKVKAELKKNFKKSPPPTKVIPLFNFFSPEAANAATREAISLGLIPKLDEATETLLDTETKKLLLQSKQNVPEETSITLDKNKKPKLSDADYTDIFKIYTAAGFSVSCNPNVTSVISKELTKREKAVGDKAEKDYLKLCDANDRLPDDKKAVAQKREEAVKLAGVRDLPVPDLKSFQQANNELLGFNPRLLEVEKVAQEMQSEIKQGPEPLKKEEGQKGQPAVNPAVTPPPVSVKAVPPTVAPAAPVTWGNLPPPPKPKPGSPQAQILDMPRSQNQRPYGELGAPPSQSPIAAKAVTPPPAPTATKAPQAASVAGGSPPAPSKQRPSSAPIPRSTSPLPQNLPPRPNMTPVGPVPPSQAPVAAKPITPPPPPPKAVTEHKTMYANEAKLAQSKPAAVPPAVTPLRRAASSPSLPTKAAPPPPLSFTQGKNGAVRSEPEILSMKGRLPSFQKSLSSLPPLRDMAEAPVPAAPPLPKEKSSAANTANSITKTLSEHIAEVQLKKPAQERSTGLPAANIPKEMQKMIDAQQAKITKQNNDDHDDPEWNKP